VRDMLCLAVIVTVVGGIVAYGRANATSLGIHAAPSGQAVYLAGESCTVNMTEDRGKYEVVADFEFCLRAHGWR
jgi:hypothetical protein